MRAASAVVKGKERRRGRRERTSTRDMLRLRIRRSSQSAATSHARGIGTSWAGSYIKVALGTLLIATQPPPAMSWFKKSGKKALTSSKHPVSIASTAHVDTRPSSFGSEDPDVDIDPEGVFRSVRSSHRWRRFNHRRFR